MSRRASRLRRTLLPLVALAAVALAPRQALAWNKAGHMVSGAIAYRQLIARDSAGVRRVVEILKQHPDYQARWLPLIEKQGMAEHDLLLFMLAARWSDDVRDDPAYNHGSWHYVNVPLAPTGDSVKLPQAIGGDLVTELKHNLAVVRDTTASGADRAIAMCWVFHLAGDIHQPLHSVSFFTSTEWPEGDRGGNLFWVRGRTGQNPINLHSFWDGLIMGTENPREVEHRAIALRAEHPVTEYAPELAQRDVTTWATVDGVRIARTAAYLDGKLAGGASRELAQTLPPDYPKAAQQVAERQMALAGYRLAELLRPTQAGAGAR